MKFVFAAVALAAICGPTLASAQMTNKDNAPRTTTTPPAVVDPDNTNKTTAAPVEGKNSFTEAQVTKRLNDNGYSNVTGLMKDAQSVWHANAMQGGKPVKVAVDYQGNITPAPASATLRQ